MTDSEPAAVGRENDRRAFHRCDECGSIVVQLSTHRCPIGDSPSTRTERERRAGDDERDPDDLVGYTDVRMATPTRITNSMNIINPAVRRETLR